jgi:phosphatidylinositol alpha-1,6-mannosyltransferase
LIRKVPPANSRAASVTQFADSSQTSLVTRTDPGRILLLSQLYPPDVGGSAVLLHEGYSRVAGSELVVAADRANHAPGKTLTGAKLVPMPIATARWGVADPRALAHHLALALRIRSHAGRHTVVHCARALPEGVAAWFASLLGGPRYACWAHGEDVTSALLSRELTLVMRLVYRGASAIFANSRNTRRLLEDLGVPAVKIQIVYPGVDVQRFTPQVDGRRIRSRVAPGADLLMLSVGRLQTRKGHDLAIAAVAALKAEFPRLVYAIVGEGAERSRLESLAHDLGVADRVRFVGEVPAGDLPEYFAACDLFVLPNRVHETDIEGFGIVFLEAAATGRPVIGGNSGGVPEAVGDDRTGVLVGGTDVHELAAAIRKLAVDPRLRERLGQAARERVLRSFTWDATAAGIRAVHGRILGLAEARSGEPSPAPRRSASGAL